MRKIDRIMRAIAFYLCVALFFILLPIILSYALGYQIDYRNLRLYKTGILYVESVPAGATIYLSGRRLPDVTPAQIEELKPGIYKVEVRRDGFYPWEKEIVIRPNMVTRADRIVLFPIKQEMRVINENGISDFFVSDNGYIYYMKRSGLFRSNMDGTSLKRLSSYSNWPSGIIGRKFSSDGRRILYYTSSTVCIIYLYPEKTFSRPEGKVKIEEVLTTSDPIINAFWYPGSNYIIVITEKEIEVVEIGTSVMNNKVTLYKFNSKPGNVYYDHSNNSLYFIDTKIGADSSQPNYLYRLDLAQKTFDSILQRLLKKEPDTAYEKR
ncbi:MAG: PEGA domain-containing protein [Candidatus Omnitrophica bacterium]|nr:PEGA domain-containing protein [Candidatus Omnitrophota bacterium]